ncbi:MAG: hypothetical protein Q9168_004937 [Polycauliona sp. 1 TL-2023]
MSFIVRRGLSTLIPPKIASASVSTTKSTTRVSSIVNAVVLVRTYAPALFDVTWDHTTRSANAVNGIGAAQDAARMERVVSFYEKLPRGRRPNEQPKGLFERYQARYFGKNPSAAPLAHLIGGLMVLGYAQHYYFHFRHHKNNAH